MKYRYYYHYYIFAILLVASGYCNANNLMVLVYHDVVANPGDNSYAVSRANFIAQMDFLEQNGYQTVSLGLLDKVRLGKAKLPGKAVLLTFDDGLKSYHDFVVPALEIYKYPSVTSIVTGWLDGKNRPKEYHGKLMTWGQVKAVSKHSLVEIVSHTHNLHHGIQSNPQGNTAAASITRQFMPNDRSYENERSFAIRIRQDLSSSVERFKAELGFQPIAVTWPYGEYDGVVMAQAKDLGMIFQLTLDEGPTVAGQLPLLNRTMLYNYNDLADFLDILDFKDVSTRIDQRFVEIVLEPFQGKSEQEVNVLLSALLDRLEKLKVNSIVLSPFSKGSKKAFFYNTSIPVEADILNRILSQMRDRVGIRFQYLKLPKDLSNVDTKQLYRDLARLNRFDGVLVDPNIDAEELRNVKRLFSHFHPNLRYGTYGIPASKLAIDYAVVTIADSVSSQMLRRKIGKLHGLAANIFIAIERKNKSDDKILVKALRVLRSSGVKHYGYSLDDYSIGKPNPIVVAEEFGRPRVGGGG